MMAATGRGTATCRWLAGLLAILLAGACVPAETGGEAVQPEAGVKSGAAPEPITLDRAQAQAHRQLGLGLESAGDIAGAVEEFDTALTFGPWQASASGGAADDNPYHDLARICARREPARPVVRACTRVIKSFRFGNEGLATFLTNRGDAQFQLGKHDRAMADYRTALKVEQNHPRGLFGRGRMRARAGDHAGAVSDFSRVIPAMPEYPEARYARARSFIALGAFDKAIADYDHILADPQALSTQAEAYRERASAHCQIGEADAAAIDWQVWLGATSGGAEYVHDMLWARGYLRGQVDEGFGPVALAALRAWTTAGCPEG
jgi:tetratricopeptide (TPR) repeat protein